MNQGISWLDVKLGIRMLFKYPGLTLVGGLGIAVAIAIGAACFAFVHSYLHPTLPLPQGERVVGIKVLDAAWNSPEHRILHDFVRWREELESVEELGAFTTSERNLIVPGGAAEPARIAEMSASGFRVARVPPLLGRPLLEADEEPGAAAVVVIGHDAWRTRFQSDPAVVGREIRVGSTPHTVVGVMPEGFAFPVNHDVWTPLRADPSDYERRQGPRISVFGRLAPGATLDEAQAELSTLGQRTAAAHPETHERLRPRVAPYPALWIDAEERFSFYVVQLLLTLLLVAIAVNVAILVYARTATRQGEIAVRSALGASRGRIVAQLFAEALVLSLAAAALALLGLHLGLGQLGAVLPWGGRLPFWMDYRVSPAVVLYATGLAVLAAVIVGVVPALRSTGDRPQSLLRELGGGTGMRMGRTWTTLVVAQVAVAVAILPGAVFSAWDFMRHAAAEPGFAAEQFLSARLAMDREIPPSAEADAHRRAFEARFGDRLGELVRRLEAEPGVAQVAFASGAPGFAPEGYLEVEGVSPPEQSPSGHRVRLSRVDLGFFDAFGAPVLAGRQFQPGDLGDAAAAVVVNRAFVERILGGGDVLGRRVREAGMVEDDEGAGVGGDGPWYEIVGVVGNLPSTAVEPGGTEARLYHPVLPGQLHPVTLAVRMRGVPPANFAPRLREITAAVDPALELQEVLPLDQFYRQKRQGTRVMALAIGLATLSVLLLSAAGIYALMSFTVARRRKEIGIRSALGADPRRLLGSIFARALRQLATGLVVGVLAAVLLETLTGGALTGGQGIVVLPAVAVLMLAVGLFAALGPARRGLRIEPTEALRADG